MFFLKAIFWTLVLGVSAEDDFYPHGGCPEPKKRMDIISCALTLHPALQKGELKLETAKSHFAKASQIPNPQLQTRFVRNGGDNSSELETSLNFTLELGGKRHARKQRAMALADLAKADNEDLKAHVKIQTILNLYRLRQLGEEVKLVKEADLAFKKVIMSLKKRPRLNAEQEAALTLFEMAYEENKVLGAELHEEERSLEHFFHVVTGHELKEIKEFLPKYSSQWPILTGERQGESPKLAKLKKKVKLAYKDLEIQKSQVWPDMKIGPAMLIEKEGPREVRMVGLNLTMPLPVLSQNRGGRLTAQSEVVRAQKTVLLEDELEEHERFEQLRIYESAVTILKKSISPLLLEKKQRKIERLYMRGVVSSSLFLDSLKQKLSYFKLRNKRELKALSALWEIYRFDGKVLKEEI
ncbi:MAG: TolC family protein [Bdellovibrionota bacterium]|nr:TolC family protein [Bdellovibrionota bacterium]